MRVVPIPHRASLIDITSSIIPSEIAMNSTAQLNLSNSDLSISGALHARTSIRVNAYANLKQNQLLAALSDEELRQWQVHLEPVDLARGQILYERAGAVKHIYFPTTSIVSLMCSTADGGSCEIAIVGNDGAVGISIFMGEETMAHSAVAQNEGRGFRMKASAMKSLFDQSRDVQLLMLRYTQALITQISQTAVSNRHFTVEQQLSRRLLMGQDRLATSELKLTQETLGNLLGVRRETVTEAAHKLQDAGLIRYSRGRITIRDRGGLERRCREFYTSMRRDFGASESAKSFSPISARR